MRLEAIVAGPQTAFRCERHLAEQLMTKLLRMTANQMSAREAAARLEPVPPARALDSPDKERSGRQLAESFAWRVAARGIASRNPQRQRRQLMMLVAGDDAQAETTMMSLATDLRFEAVDAGPLAMSRHLLLSHLGADLRRAYVGAGDQIFRP